MYISNSLRDEPPLCLLPLSPKLLVFSSHWYDSSCSVLRSLGLHFGTLEDHFGIILEPLGFLWDSSGAFWRWGRISIRSREEVYPILSGHLFANQNIERRNKSKKNSVQKTV